MVWEATDLMLHIQTSPLMLIVRKEKVVTSKSVILEFLRWGLTCCCKLSQMKTRMKAWIFSETEDGLTTKTHSLTIIFTIFTHFIAFSKRFCQDFEKITILNPSNIAGIWTLQRYSSQYKEKKNYLTQPGLWVGGASRPAVLNILR